MVKALSATYQQSEYAAAAREKINQIISTTVRLHLYDYINEIEPLFKLFWSRILLWCAQRGSGNRMEGSKSHASFVRQCTTLTQRSFVNMTRDPGYYWLRVAMYVMVGICLGTIFWKVGLRYNSILVSTSHPCPNSIVGPFPSLVIVEGNEETVTLLQHSW